MIITITGFPASGKSTLGKELAKTLGLKHYSAGDFLREIAAEKGKTLLQIHREMEKDRRIDDEIDNRTKRLGRTHDDFVMDSRLAWHFLPKSIKIFVKVDFRTAAERVFRDKRPGEKENVSVAKTEENIRQRMHMEQARYKRLYGVDFLDERNFDIVVDTTRRKPEETEEVVLSQLNPVFGKRSKGACR